MFITGTRVKVAGSGKGNVTDLLLKDGQAYVEVTLDSGEVIHSCGPELSAIR